MRNYLTYALVMFIMVGAYISFEPWARGGQSEKHFVSLAGKPVDVYTYRTVSCDAPTLLVVFAGYYRNAKAYRDRSISLAERACFNIVAPRLTRDDFPNWRYHRAGVYRGAKVQSTSKWTIHVIRELIAWARAWEGRPGVEYRLFGHSAGGQLLSRLSAYSPPAGASRIVIANSSTYVFPSLAVDVPNGFGGLSVSSNLEAQIRRYLALPITIFLGDADTGDHLRDDSDSALQQGRTRYERGKNVFAAAKAVAERKDWEFNWKLVIAHDIGHSSEEMLNAAAALDAFFARSEEINNELAK